MAADFPISDEAVEAWELYALTIEQGIRTPLNRQDFLAGYTAAEAKVAELEDELDQLRVPRDHVVVPAAKVAELERGIENRRALIQSLEHKQMETEAALQCTVEALRDDRWPPGIRIANALASLAGEDDGRS